MFKIVSNVTYYIISRHYVFDFHPIIFAKLPLIAYILKNGNVQLNFVVWRTI